MHSAVDLVICLGDFNGHMCRHIDGFMGGMAYRAEEFGRNNVIRVLSGKGIMCVKYMV